MAYQEELCGTCGGTGCLPSAFIPEPDMSLPGPADRSCTDCDGTGLAFDDEYDDDDERSFGDDEDED